MSRRRKFILVPMGSSGDVLPFAWLADGLHTAGHEVVVIVHSPLRHHFRTPGIRTITYGTAEDFEVIVHHPDLWHPRRGFGLIARMCEPLHQHILPLIQ